MYECQSPYIVSFYGAFLNEGDVVMCMEYMDCGYGALQLYECIFASDMIYLVPLIPLQKKLAQCVLMF